MRVITNHIHYIMKINQAFVIFSCTLKNMGRPATSSPGSTMWQAVSISSVRQANHHLKYWHSESCNPINVVALVVVKSGHTIGHVPQFSEFLRMCCTSIKRQAFMYSCLEA